MEDLSRRRLLQVGGTGTALTLAGCNAMETSDEAVQTSEDRFVTVAVNIDQEADQELRESFQQRQQEIQQQVQEGELTDEEAQEAFTEAQSDFQEGQQDLIAESVTSIEDHASGVEALSVSESQSDLGVLLVGGEAAPLIELLALDSVAGLLAEARFEELQETGN